MNLQMDNIVYWRKNQVVLVVKSNALLEKEAILKPELDPVWSKIRDEFKSAVAAPEALSNLDLNHMQTIVYPSSRVYFLQVTPPAQGNAGIVDLSGMDHTLDVIKKLRDVGKSNGHDYIAIPNLLNSSVDNTHGCPVSPPYPVEEVEGSGSYKITLPQLPENLQSARGKDVTVFVLDTLPQSDRIKTAADDAGDHNVLLKEMVAGKKDTDPYDARPPAINLNYSFDNLIPSSADSAKTGKDIYGRLVGFSMEDHGLAIAGIIRDLAPDANIECIRVLNDYGVGDLHTLLSALDYIYKRVSDHGESFKLPVVINLSLVLMPPEHDIHDGSLPGIDDIISESKEVLYSILDQAGSNAIFIASAGNDSDTRDVQMNPTEVRFSARYPAAFADDKVHPIARMIPVGAVNMERTATIYSNYPGASGVATYGGELPRPNPWLPSAITHGITHVDDTSPIDAIRGIYTGEKYPALSVNDDYPDRMNGTQMENPQQGVVVDYPMYGAPNTCAWAYWSGTSYATPIISALAARIVECEQANAGSDTRNIRDIISEVAQVRRELWTRVVEYKEMGSPETSEPEDLDGMVVLAVQDWCPR
jgi:hypothetical protein